MMWGYVDPPVKPEDDEREGRHSQLDWESSLHLTWIIQSSWIMTVVGETSFPVSQLVIPAKAGIQYPYVIPSLTGNPVLPSPI